MLSLITRPFLRSYVPKQAPTKPVAVVVPAALRAELTADEKISLRHLRHHLGAFDKFLILPEGSPMRIEGLKAMAFPRKFFGSVQAHNRLLFSAGFYKRFADYKFILIYHLDALVFSDGILEWCETDVDYIGAPWIPSPEMQWISEPRVGNGGFALMNVASVLKVLYHRHCMRPGTFWKDRWAIQIDALRFFVDGHRLGRFIPLRGRARSRLTDPWHKVSNLEVHRHANDMFWSYDAVKYCPQFKVASVEQGLRFAFESSPHKCLEMTGGRMPLGCHAWPRYDREFWTPHLLPDPENGQKAS